MPYIKQENRNDLDVKVDLLHKELTSKDNNKGDYNYVISRLMHLYIKEKGICYDNLSNVSGILNDIIVEFNRTIVAPYEDKKIKENGSVNVLINIGD